MKILDWTIMKNGASSVIDKKIVIYGASSVGARFVQFIRKLELDGRIMCMCDSDEKKWKKEWGGYQTISPEELLQIKEEVMIVVASVYIKEIISFLKEKECQFDVISASAYKLAVHYDICADKANYIDESIKRKYKDKYDDWKAFEATDDHANAYNIHNLHIVYKKMMMETPCILLHGIPKTGNTTLRTSLEHIKNVAYTNHRMYYNEHSKKYLEEMILKDKENKIKIIAGIREPIERIISYMWNDISIPYLYGDSCPSSLIDNQMVFIEPKANETFQSSIRRLFLDTEAWFEYQIEQIFGIDVYAFPFDADKGYTVIEKENVSILLYRLDYMNKLENEIGEFCGISNLKLKRDNSAKTKNYAIAYEEYLNEVRIDSKLFDKIINGKTMKHFYTEKERGLYLEKWKSKIIGE